MAKNINYTRINFVDNQTILNSDTLNKMDVAIDDVVKGYNAIPEWSKAQEKPQYTASEVGADTDGTAKTLIERHDNNDFAHTNLSRKGHTHTAAEVSGIADVEVNNAKKLDSHSADYYLNYKNFTFTPDIPTKVSELENDSEYITRSEAYKHADGKYSVGAITEPYNIFTGFPLDTLIICRRGENNGIVKQWAFYESTTTTDYSIEFTLSGFIIQCNLGKEFNTQGYYYSWVAISRGVSELPAISEIDNGKVLQVKNGVWDKANIDAVFKNDLYITSDIGEVKVPEGSSYVKLATTGKNFEQVLNMIVCKRKDPIVTYPTALTLLTCPKLYEVGTTVNPSYKVLLRPGNYSYGPETGCIVESTSSNPGYQVEGYKTHDGQTSKVYESTSGESTCASFVACDGDEFYISAKVHHSNGAVPYNNIEEEVPEKKILSGYTEESMSEIIKTYRKTFFGSFTELQAEFDSPTIRSLSSLDIPVEKGTTFDLPVPVGARQVTFAYPNNISLKYKLTSVVIPVGRVRGDIIYDGAVNDLDVDRLLRTINREFPMPEAGTAEFFAHDVNNDGQITVKDLNRVAKIMSGDINTGLVPEALGNWTNVGEAAINDYQFYKDYTVSGVTANQKLDCSDVTGTYKCVAVADNTVRVYTKQLFTAPMTLDIYGFQLYEDVTKVLDTNAFNANVVEAFKANHEQVFVTAANGEDPILYNVYSIKYAEPNDTENIYKVTI